MQETQVQPLGQEYPLKKEMETLSSIFAWRIPWAEDPRRLQPIGLHRVVHDWSDLAQYTKIIEKVENKIIHGNFNQRKGKSNY